MLTGLLLLASLPASAAGTWHALASRAPDAIDTMMLLPDGTVMAAQAGNGQGTHWYKLTPDATGSYINGTWSSRAAMHDTRLYYSSAVLQDGRVFIAGGEYGSGGGTAEMYDPQADTWTQLPNSHQFFSDSGCVMLADGNVLVAPVQPNPLGTTIIYNVKSNSWSAPIPLIRGVYQDEASWVKLPDDSILTIDPFGFKSERFIPSLNQWVNDSDVPVTLYDPYLFELGAAFLLPNGNAFYLGSVSNTAIYTPSGNSSPGVWTRGPDIPDGMGAPDAPAAMMVNGKILCALSQAPITNDFPSPTSFYEYDSSTNGFAQITGPLGQTLPIPAFILRMVCLPDGSVLVSASDDQLYIYQPDGTPLAQGKPTISGISVNPDGSYHVAGTGFNGLSQGASYGDDAQMDSNYPLVRFTDRSGNVFYGRTFNWSSTGVRTGTSPVSTDFVTAPGMPAGVYSLVVVGNGFASDPINFAPVQPLLSVVTNSISGGNGNGQIDYIECNDFNVTITNQGAGLATHVRGTISVNTPFAHAGVRTIDFHDLPPGTGASTLTPFKISTEPGFVCGTPVDVTLVLSSDQTVVTNAIRLSSGVLGTPVRFDNSTLTNIPDGDPIGLMSPITVSNFNSAVAKVTVSTFIVHPFDADLRMELIAPDGTSVLLSDLNGGNGQNYGTSCFPDSSRTTFDDGASNSITAGIPPFTGSYKPMQALAVFNGRNGTNINGTWKLHVIDRFQFDVGFLSCWSLQLTPYQCVDGGGECPGSDLSVTLSAFPNPALISSNITFTMVVSNAGPSSAKAVVVNQTLPTNFVYITGSASQGSVGYLPGMVSANLGNLGVNASAVVTVTALSVTNGTFTTVATVGAPTTDIDTSNNSASLNVRVEKPTADIAVTMTAAPNPVLAGGTLTYTMVVTNNGPFTATGVVLTNILPSNVVFISSSTTQGTFANSAAGILTLLGDIAAGSNATVTIAVSPGAVGIFNASAQVAADSFIFDPVTGNNHASVSTTVNPAADLEITMAANPANVLLNSNFSYTITVVNHGPSLAQSVQMSQSFQGGLTILSNTISAGTITNQGGAVTANIG
ncbi:MAG: proprotein convertase P-domain-containing protein, partial [Limisphaerales bacterium]